MVVGSDRSDDQALVASRVDSAQVDSLFELRAREIWRYLAAHLGPAAADELLSEVFVRAFAARERFDPDRGTARGWLYGIATNVCREAVRREPKLADRLDGAQSPTTKADVADAVALRDALQRAVAQLPDDRRAVLLLIGAAGLSYSDLHEKPPKLSSCPEEPGTDRTDRYVERFGGLRRANVASDGLPDLAGYLAAFGEPDDAVLAVARERIERLRTRDDAEQTASVEPDLDRGFDDGRSLGGQRGGRWRRTSVVVAVAAVTVAAIPLLVGRGPSSNTATHHPSRRTGSTVVTRVPGSETTLIIWPATACCQVPDTVYVDDLVTGSLALRNIPPVAGGDYPNPLLAIDRWVVYNGEAGNPGVFALRSDLEGQPRRLGSATWFVPGVGDHVLLVSNPFSSAGSTVRSVSLANGAVGPAVKLPPHAGLVAGTDSGLLLVTSGRLTLWQNGRQTQLAVLAQGSDDLFGASARVVAYGSGCKWAEAYGFSNSPVGYRLCAQLHVFDVATGHGRVFDAPAGTLGWQPHGFLGDVGVIAPDNKALVAEAGVPHARKGRGRLFVVPLSRATGGPREVTASEVPLTAQTAWSPTGSWLFYEAPARHLEGTQLTTGHTVTLAVRLSSDGLFALASLIGR